MLLILSFSQCSIDVGSCRNSIDPGYVLFGSPAYPSAYGDLNKGVTLITAVFVNVAIIVIVVADTAIASMLR